MNSWKEQRGRVWLGPPHAEPRRRTPLLVVVLVLLTVGLALGLLTNLAAWGSLVSHGQSEYLWAAILGVMINIVGLAAIIGVWRWRRRAVFLFALAAVAGLVLDASLISGAASALLIVRLCLLALLAFSIRRQWPSFR